MKKYILIALRLTIALILIQTLRYKFSAHPDSVYIFTKVGMEPFGRIGVGIIELIAAVLIIFPKTAWMGAAITLSVIGGALFLHLTILGIEINGDGGSLFFLALITEILSGFILWDQRNQIPQINQVVYSK